LELPVQRDFNNDRKENDNLIRCIFGSPQVRSPLRFADLVSIIPEGAERESGISHIRPSVTINRRRGTAEDQRLLMQEVAREGLVFQHEQAITGQLPDLAHVALLWAATKLTTRWGGAKSRGLGWCRIDAQIYWNGATAHINDTELAAALRSLKEHP
jgi:CRISPR/Cas system CSM-associated protein Csm3 (group 7 of RAMP superfamily)